MPLLRFKKVSAIGRGSWMVWLDVPATEKEVVRLVMNPADQGTREMHDGH